jgi:hypothetical protein
MSASICGYCDRTADVYIGDLWLCQAHGSLLEASAGGLVELLEMTPDARRALADYVLPRLLREDVYLLTSSSEL